MTYEEILSMIENAAYNRFFKGLNYDGLQSTLIECTTKIYIAQMQLEKEKLQEESNRKSSEPVEKRMTLDDWLKKEKEEKNNVKE